ncbi:NUC091 domain-domain-containing protein [Catenaria anguillulae PL171]|uniref:Nucleolar GTP-binding protein 2 n=1 Tax=Catenaria anguillulae PL171 TaxID=765915 RepID=A0A1Y2I2S6_9FUNG|nr:NUC091 domain-domain-containing protein [Catenaria anguillulae PL171]
MGVHKKEANRTTSIKGKVTKTITKMKGENFYRDQTKLKYLNMLKGGKAVRNEKGEIVKAADFQSSTAGVARVEPNRKWFGNTRVIGQKQLELFRDEMAKRANDPYTVLLRQNKLPLSLLKDSTKTSQVHMLDNEPFANTFGPKAQRKKPKLKVEALDELTSVIEESLDQYNPKNDLSLPENQQEDFKDKASDTVFMKGQSKRIWNELYKVIDSSDVVIHVLDARDPMGTRCRNVETYIKKEAPHKHLMFLLNKCDLVPTWVTARWVKKLSAEAPTLAFHASIQNPFGKGALIQLLRQYSKLHTDKKQISVGLIGYPNTGKSSIINTLKKKKVCNVAPIPGETKIWQYVTLMRKIYLIDCPGIVYPAEDTETDIVLKGVIRVENLKNPEDHMADLISRVKPVYLRKTYELSSWTDHLDFLEQIARKSGRLLKGGEPDVSTVAKMVLTDWLRGKIPFFATPPEFDESLAASAKPAAGPHVEQHLRKIPVVATFEKDDLVNKEDKEKLAAAAAQAQAEPTLSSDEEEEDDDEVAGGEGQPDWDEIFDAVEPEMADSIPGQEGEEEEEDASFVEDGASDDDVSLNGDIAESDSDSDMDGAFDLEAESGSGSEEEEQAEEEDVAASSSSTPAALTPEAVAAAIRGGKARKGVIASKSSARPTSASATSSRPTKKRSADDAADEDQDGSSGSPIKKQRMTTNKRKVGAHYYESANVKNKNRAKTQEKPVSADKLARVMKGDGKRKVTDGGKKRRR